MDDLSRVAEAKAITPMSKGVWRVQKKRKTAERQRQNGKRDQRKKSEEKRGDLILAQSTEKIDKFAPPAEQQNGGEPSSDKDIENQIGYGSVKLKKSFAQKIDLII
jgi:hypothetical protein